MNVEAIEFYPHGLTKEVQKCSTVMHDYSPDSEEFALAGTFLLWTWVANNPRKKEEDWPLWNKYKKVIWSQTGFGFACANVTTKHGGNCYKCPVPVFKTSRYCDEDINWENEEEMKKRATEIAACAFDALNALLTRKETPDTIQIIMSGRRGAWSAENVYIGVLKETLEMIPVSEGLSLSLPAKVNGVNNWGIPLYLDTLSATWGCDLRWIGDVSEALVAMALEPKKYRWKKATIQPEKEANPNLAPILREWKSEKEKAIRESIAAIRVYKPIKL